MDRTNGVYVSFSSQNDRNQFEDANYENQVRKVQTLKSSSHLCSSRSWLLCVRHRSLKLAINSKGIPKKIHVR